ncbi:MAG TPA: hypothetical protein G4O05_07450, partial [Caldilineae bacterium]|nr:hypothetical protein [Caldilineae bacterium]
ADDATPTSADATTGAAQPPPLAGLRDELGDSTNTWDEITHDNNFYEFTAKKTKVAKLAEGYPTEPWCDCHFPIA